MSGDATWKALDHGPLDQLEPDLWRVEGSLPHMPLRRVMTIARREDGQLVVHSAISLDRAGMRAVDALGPVGFIVVPNGMHRLDAARWRARYPGAKVVAPSGARSAVEQQVPVDLDEASFPSTERASIRALGGVAAKEMVMTLRSGGTATLVFTDALFDMPHLPGLQGFVLRHLTRSSGPLHVSRLFRLLAVKDAAAFRADLLALAETPDLRRIIVAHHRVVDVDVAAALRAAAGSNGA